MQRLCVSELMNPIANPKIIHEFSFHSNSRRVQSFESHTNLAPLLGALKRADELFCQLREASPDIVEHVAMRDCQTALLSIRSIYPYYSNNLMKPSVLNAVSDVQSELGRLAELVSFVIGSSLRLQFNVFYFSV